MLLLIHKYNFMYNFLDEGQIEDEALEEAESEDDSSEE